MVHETLFFVWVHLQGVGDVLLHWFPGSLDVNSGRNNQDLLKTAHVDVHDHVLEQG